MTSKLKEIYQRLVRLVSHKVKTADTREQVRTYSSPESGAELVASIIIPIRVNHQAQEAIARLHRLLSFIPECFEIVVVDDGSAVRWQKEICNLVIARQDSRYIYLRTIRQRFSLARARNCGASHSKSEIVVFHDLDFLGTSETYLQIADVIRDKLISAEKQHFFCVPVAFLTEAGTASYLRFLDSKPVTTNWGFYQSATQGQEVKFLVQGSSCIVVRRDYFLEIGGHDESYDGHGAEDFELLHRLSLKYSIATRPPDYSVNTGSGKISEYRGFRAFFALYGEECTQAGCLLVHLYHPKRKESGYYQHERNFAKLKALMLNDTSQ